MAARPPSSDWREDIAPDENERFARHAAFLGELQRRHDRRAGAGRALHRRAHVGVEATLEVAGELPPEARAGLFARPGRYRAYVRTSNGSAAHQADDKPDIRGLAVKVVGVPGKKLIPGLEDAPTQDFLFIQLPAIAFRNADEFVGFVRAVSRPLLAVPRLVAGFGLGGTVALMSRLRAALGPRIASLAEQRFYTALPIRMGDHAGKLGLVPVGPAAAQPRTGPTYLADELAARLAAGPVRYDVVVQLYRDAQTTPIEDASVEWTEAAAPPIRVARLTLEQQDVSSPRGRKVAAYVEKLAFDPWHALVEHRPLGDIMRARNHAYRVSTQNRGAAGEPDGSERFE
jgi:catalase